MVRIEIVNDGTANIPENIATPPNGEPFCLLGNYDYRVFINTELVAKGRIKDHLRISGWQGLISCLERAINGERFREDTQRSGRQGDSQLGKGI